MKMVGEDPEMEEHEIECWADALIKAEEIKADKDKMAKVAPVLAKRKAALDSIPIMSMKDLKAKANSMPDEGAE